MSDAKRREDEARREEERREEERREEEGRRSAEKRVKTLALNDPQKEVLLNALGAARVVAKKLGFRWSALIETVDLIGIGHLAVLEVKQRYNPSKGDFGPYAAYRVLGAILDAIRKQSTYRHYIRLYTQGCEFLAGQVDQGDLINDSEETTRWRLTAFSDQLLGSALTASLDDLSHASGEWAITEQQAFAHALSELRDVRAALPEHDRMLLAMHYDQGMKLEDVGPELGMSYAKVRRRHGEILMKLLDGLRARGIRNAAGDEYLPGEGPEHDKGGGELLRRRRNER